MARIREAAREGDPKRVENLLCAGSLRSVVSPNTAGDEGATAFHIAAGLVTVLQRADDGPPEIARLARPTSWQSCP